MTLLQTLVNADVPTWGLVAIKATIAILIALTATTLARRARASLRHAVYAALFALLLLLPFSTRVIPPMSVSVPVPAVAATPQVPPAAAPVEIRVAPREPATDNWLPSLADVYRAGLFLMFASLVVGVVRLQRIAAAGTVWLDGTKLALETACASAIRHPVLVILSNEVSVPMTFGFRRQTIVVPAGAVSWDSESLRRALRHELEHVRRNDWAQQILARVVCSVYWPHPLVWTVWKRFCVEAERACDDPVVRAFEPAVYADQLVTLARAIHRETHVPALAMASRTRLSERVHAILDPEQRRGPHGRFASLTTTAVMVSLLVFFGSVRLVAAMEKPERERPKNDHSLDDRPNIDYDDPYRETIVKAAERGSIHVLEEIVAAGMDVNKTYDGDGTMLLIAARAGHVDAVRYLLDHGADPNVPSPGDGNPLIAAAGHGRVKMVELLLNRGARIDEVVPGDENALITAADGGFDDVVHLLIERGADVNLGVWADGDDGRKPDWRTPLIMARRHHYEGIARMLIAAGARE